MKITAEPRSDQWNADDFVGGSRVFTIAGVKVGTAEQKYDIELVEGEGRVWRPPLTVLRLLIEAWGDEAAAWVGRRVRLYRDESVRFGADAVGGIRIVALSDLTGGKPLTAKVTMSRGRKAPVTIQPLVEAAPAKPAPTAEPSADVATITDRDVLTRMWKAAPRDSAERTVIEARVAELNAPAPDGPGPTDADWDAMGATS